ncbi:hypothetical protein RA307_09745 [Xanthobacteraceae bacterium Astr-EGSB]|uniref:hypothetical protein n=1 Tax=Astrobacterium formosum TaxID=3069710 RepID=UPI0027B46F3A|nr:hypothetical protein [Xanthobacteraceae bacterium Astr-EGSB]
MIEIALSFLAAKLAALGPLALAGGPLGVAIAWAGGLAGNRTVKVLAIVAGLVLVVAVTVGLTVHVQHLERDRVAYRMLAAEVDALAAAYGCPARAPAERALPACLTARERDAASARADELARQRREAAQAQAVLDRADAAADAASAAEQAAILEAAPADDGPVPRVLLDAWARKRKERGLK